MPATLQAALLGVVQGLTEFLPVSSSAHLILARAFFGFDADRFGLAFDVACHVGTLIAVLIFFRREVGQMIRSLPRVFNPGPAVNNAGPRGPQKRGSGADENDQGARLIWLLVIGTIPAVVVGLLFNTVIEEHMRVPQVAAVALALGAIMFFVAERAGTKTRSDRSLTMAEAFWLGCAQAIALVPGVSRSGVTIAVALFMGLRRTDAARFIFLLAIPAILAAAANEGLKVFKTGLDAGTVTLFMIGIVTSAIVGYAAIRFCIRYFANHSLDVFAWYRLALAAAVVVWMFR
jgi:undecaprenyl-diphosphatase